MPKKHPDFDLKSAHRHFAVTCFNETWRYINKKRRTEDDKRAMLQLAMTSLWHWRQRKDATPTNFCISYWQVSRVYALLGDVDNARMYGNLCLKASKVKGVEPVFMGFAYETLARAEAAAGNKTKRDAYLAKARTIAKKVTDDEDRGALEDDLATIK